jgi:hypothetical protein
MNGHERRQHVLFKDSVHFEKLKKTTKKHISEQPITQQRFKLDTSSEVLDFWTSPFVQCSKNYRKHHFRDYICFYPQVRVAIPIHWVHWKELSSITGTNRVGVSPLPEDRKKPNF